METFRQKIRLLCLVMPLLVTLAACSNMPFVEENKAYSRIFVTDFATAWAAALEAVATATDVVQNRDLGTIETGWYRNTDGRNFFEAFKPEDQYNRARYRVFLYVRQGKKMGKRATVVRVQVEQEVEKSPFSNWEMIESTGLVEATFLYRIGRLIALQEYAEKKDEEKSKNLKLSL